MKLTECRSRLIAEGADPQKVERFLAWHQMHRDVWAAFEKFSLQVADSGKRRYGSMAILNRIRWYVEIESRSGEFKVCNDWAPYYARIFSWEHPQYFDLFVTKQLKKGEEQSYEREFYT